MPDRGRLTASVDEFVLLWGEMASQWGINRTMAQIHALLYATERPMDTDEIMERLQISRGNANMNLRALVDWTLVSKTHQLGSRKDFFVAEKDVWKITTTVIEERRRREIKPVQESLSALAADLHDDEETEAEAAFAERVENLVEMLSIFDGFTAAVLPFLRDHRAEHLQRVIRFASRLRNGEPSPD